MRKIQTKKLVKLTLQIETYINLKKLFAKGVLFPFNMKGFFNF